ncbi:MAG: GNAT family N-acetyltransferase [Caldilineaceae bacterium]|nr:GNAT family N-acetyltransferase [Caldilineaceae bacterium]
MKSIQTSRLYLRRFNPEDFDDIIEQIYSDPEVYRYYSSIAEEREEVERRFRVRCAQPQSAEFGFWAVELRQHRKVIGQLHLEPYVNNYNLIPGEEGDAFRRIEVELAFAFGRHYWGQGYATEACQAAIDYAFLDLKLPRLVGSIKTVNERSIRHHLRLGYRVFPNPTDEAWQIARLDNDRLTPAHAKEVGNAD